MLGNLNYGLGTVRLSGIDVGGGEGYEMRYEDSNLDCGSVYKQYIK
jgi:hypothetical protein